MKQIAAFAVLFVAMSGVANACQFDTDCNPGSRCSKQFGAMYGVCVDGISPGNANDRQPAKFFPDINQTYGNTCQFDTECGPGRRCVKGSGIYGTCSE